MTELRHLQLVILTIIKDIDVLCRAHGIRYYLLGGSAIGAIRHKGFIPWDDDLDIIMPAQDYDRFVELCRTHLDKEKYYVQEGLKDWPVYFSKVKLRGTHFEEPEAYSNGEDTDGIFVDIFRLDNVADGWLSRRVQYVLAKMYLSWQLSVRSYGSASLKKKLLMGLSFPLRCKCLRDRVKKYVESWNDKDTECWGFFYGRSRWRTTIVPRKIYGEPLYVPFEDTQLPVPQHYHEYLTIMFGDYMQLPPEEQRVGQHLMSVDFGNY